MHTLVKRNTVGKISHIVDQHINLFSSFSSIYLFGSILDVDSIPNDIDILLIYTEYSDRIISEVSIIRLLFTNQIELPMDFTVLSAAEEEDTIFLKRLNSKYLKLK